MRLRGPNVPLESRIRRRLRIMEEHVAAAGPPPDATVPELMREECVRAPLMGWRRLLKVKAHQADEMTPEQMRAASAELKPCVFVVAGNKAADKGAGEARTMAEVRSRKEVRYCAGGENCFYSWKGRMVVAAVGRFLRQEGQAAALEEWAKRPAQGAVAIL